MEKLRHEDLYSLEEYDRRRSEFRAHVMAHKLSRQMQIGPHVRLYFEDRLTMHYQVQEMLRTERIFERAGIEDELGAYNPLIPDGSNWKATLMMEYEDVAERLRSLAKMIGIEDRVWIKVDGFERVCAVADEDLQRETEDKTSSVHFLRFELTADMVAAVKRGADVSVGIDHEAYMYQVNRLDEAVRDSLAQDLNQ
ncbi:MAG: DUF3501 family protein [Acidiferrobacterales bacterium]